MTKKKFKWFTLIRLAGIILFVVILARTDLGELWGWLKNVNLWWVGGAFLFQLMLLLIKCFRWLWMNESGFERKKVFQRSGEFLEAYALGAITPGRLGEIMKAGHSKGRSNVVSSVLLVISERGLDLSLFFLMAGISLSLGYLPAMTPTLGYTLTVVAIIGIIMAFSILLFPAVVRWIDIFLKKIKMIASDQNLVFIHRNGKAIAIFSVLSVLSNLCSFLSFYCIALAVMINLGFMPVSGSVALAGIINSIPVTIMGIGTRDVTLLYVMGEIPKAQILAFSGLILLISQIGGGIIAMLSGQFFLYKAKRTI